MFSIQEILEKTAPQRRQVIKALDGVNSENGWHPEDANIFGTGTNQTPLSLSDQIGIQETLNKLSLSEILILGASTNGASALVSNKLYDTLIYASKQYDLCPLLSAYMAEKWQGGNLSISIAKDGTYKARKFVGGAKIPEVQPSFVQGTLKPEAYGIPILGGADLIEDEQFGIVQWNVEQAAKAVGKQATDLMVTKLLAATDGDGVLNSGNADTAETKWGGSSSNDVVKAYQAVSQDEFKANTVVCTGTTWGKSLSLYTGTNGWHPLEPQLGFDARIGVLDVAISNSPALHSATDVSGAVFLANKTVVFDRNNAVLTGRKRWMEIKNYSDPVQDILGAVVSFRQNSVSLYNDAIYVLTEQ